MIKQLDMVRLRTYTEVCSVTNNCNKSIIYFTDHSLCSCTGPDDDDDDDVKLVGGTSHCNGVLEIKHQGTFFPVDVLPDSANLSLAVLSAVVCRQLACSGFSDPAKRSDGPLDSVRMITSSNCVGSESTLRECSVTYHRTSSDRLKVFCTGNELAWLFFY